MTKLTREDIQDWISSGDLAGLFISRLHWDNPRPLQPNLAGSLELEISGTELVAHPVASKRLVDAWRIPCESIPPRADIRKTVVYLRKLHSLELLIVFDAERGEMVWLWPEQRTTGSGFQLVEYNCQRDAMDGAMLDRLLTLRFDPEEEDQLTSTAVLERVRRSLDVDLAGLEKQVERTISTAARHLRNDRITSKRIGEILYQEPGHQSNMMAIAIMFNAVVFQHHLAERHHQVPSPAHLREAGLHRAAVEAAWHEILEINYWPIFGIARDLLVCFKEESTANKVLKELYGKAAETTAHRDTQGIIGELYGKLVADRAFLKTHFTRLGAAAFLAEMAVDRLDVDWADRDAIARLRVADLACGTGALLTAAYRRIAARYQEAGGDPADIHQDMMEKVLIGCDIMPASVHLTAATLSGEHPEVDYERTQTWVMPFGMKDVGMGEEPRIGSLDLLGGSRKAALLGDGSIAPVAKGTPVLVRSEAFVPTNGMHLMIMNPPFGRPHNHERKQGAAEDGTMPPIPVFAGMGNDEEAQALMSTALKDLYTTIQGLTAGHGNAGMASNFMDLAHMKLCPGGVLGLIVPATVVSGKAWEEMRELLAEWYDMIQVVTLADTTTSQSRAFSADTDMAEAIIVAIKRHVGEARSEEARYLCLRERPETPGQGIDLARAVRPGGDLDRPGGSPAGFAVVSHLSKHAKGHPSGVISADLCGISAALSAREELVRLPQVSRVFPIHTASLGELGCRGPYHLTISRGPFERVSLRHRADFPHSKYPVLWSHNHRFETNMTVFPCSEGLVRSGERTKAQRLWEGYEDRAGERIAGATRLHINNDFQINSQPTAACLTPTPALGGRAWPSFQPEPSRPSNRLVWEKALCVWLNSTLGLVGRWWVSSRQQKGRANLTVTTIGNIPVLDLRQLTPARVQAAAALFDEFENREFLPANEAYRDPARADLDRALAQKVLHLPEEAIGGIARLRDMWCREPSVHGNKSTRPGGPSGS